MVWLPRVVAHHTLEVFSCNAVDDGGVSPVGMHNPTGRHATDMVVRRRNDHTLCSAAPRCNGGHAPRRGPTVDNDVATHHPFAYHCLHQRETDQQEDRSTHCSAFDA